ncbi:glycosyl transferase [Candidatus Woesearchaeota archaeon]|nr:glycosyl transferase [Candidatus Woesearchaeota archaeon]
MGADLIVGIPSYCEADSIRYVVEQVDKGLTKYFPNHKTLIVNCDNDSPDGTRRVFLETPTNNQKYYVSTPPGLKGKGRNFYNLFLLTQKLGAKGVIVVDADLTSITPEWIKHLGGQVMEREYDFVSPLYLRHKYDGTITNHLVYPLVFSLLGKNIRQPIGGDFAFSTKLASHWLSQEWKESTHMYGIDNFMTLHALIADFKVCQTGLGSKDHKPSAPKLGPMFLQVIDTLFENLLRNQEDWEKSTVTEETQRYGIQMSTPKELSLEDIGIDLEAMEKNATTLFTDYKLGIQQILSPDLFEELQKMFIEKEISISESQWAMIVYDFLASFSMSTEEDDKLRIVELLKPLYFGRSLSFINQTINLGCEEAERLILRQAQIFRELKPYLINKLSQKRVLI